MATLTELVDFDYLNDAGPRISVGAVDIETGNFAYFDSSKIRIDARHIMASGALPPGFPPVEIDGRFYWDGGLVSNTPLQYVMENAGRDPLCIFQIDLFSARGDGPERPCRCAAARKGHSLFKPDPSDHRQISGNCTTFTRPPTDLPASFPKICNQTPIWRFLRDTGPECPVTLAHLIHRKEGFESNSKDYEFSRLSMTEHWAAGMADANGHFRTRHGNPARSARTGCRSSTSAWKKNDGRVR